MNLVLEIYQGLQEATVRQLQEAPVLKYALGIVYFKQGKGRLDTDCIICLNDALRDFRKLSAEDFRNIIQSKMKTSNSIFTLKGTRTFLFKNQRWNNDILTDSLAAEWIQGNPKRIQNFIFTKEAVSKAADLGIPQAEIEFWGKMEKKTAEEVAAMIQKPQAKAPGEEREADKAEAPATEQAPQAKESTPSKRRKAATKK